MTARSGVEAIETIAGIRRVVGEARKAKKVVSLVPTMGALHAGHGALMDRARAESDFVVVSIFVNPIQFDRAEDYAAYRINLAEDLEFCAEHKADAVFAPTPAEMYPQPQKAFVEVEGLSEHLCGKFRAGHFRGVATVVMKLFQIAGPDKAYFGEKDAQQLAVIRRMALDLEVPVEIIAVGTVREADGLALSSRNQRLSPEERKAAPALYRALSRGARRIGIGVAAGSIREAVREELAETPALRMEYVEVVDEENMTPVERVEGPVRIAAAVWLGQTRLIDNVSWRPEQ